MKIVSLLPSATEIVAALGLADKLVGRSHECDWPVGLAHLPVLTAPKMSPQADAATIDRDVRGLVEDGTSVYKLDAEVIRAMAPDFVITQSQCELCAVSLDEVQKALQDWVGAANGPKLVSLEPMQLADVATDIHRVAAALGVVETGDKLVRQMADGFAALRSETRDAPRQKVFFMEWTAPLMGAGNWMPETIAVAGGEVVLGAEGVHSPTVGWDDISAADPDVIIVGPCGFDIERGRRELQPVLGDAAWQKLRAVQDGQVFVVNGNHFFNRPGPRLVQSARIVAEILHPDKFAPDNHGTGWVRHA